MVSRGASATGGFCSSPPKRPERAAETLDDAGVEVRLERYGVGHGTTPEEGTDIVEWVEVRY